MNGPKHLLVKISRAKFNELTKDLVDRSLNCMKNTLREVDLDISEIDDVILVGGTTRIPVNPKKD